MKHALLVPASLVALCLGAQGCSRTEAPSVPANTSTPASPMRPADEGGVIAPSRGKANWSVPAKPSSSKVEIADLFYLRSAGDPQLSPDGARVAFTVQYNDRVGPPYSRVWTADVAKGTASPFATSEGQEGGTPRWSPDGTKLAYAGRAGDSKSGIVIANADGSGAALVAETEWTNHPIPRVGDRFAWSPDGKRIAFVSATPGPEPAMEADPIVITRYWYRPASGWPSRFVDNKRTHLFVVDVASKQVTPLTDGTFYEHSIDWAPDSKQLVFLSNREPGDPDQFFNYDIFTIDVDSKATKRLTTTKNNEFAPVWSPDGKTIAYSGLKRPMTSSETNMEDDHVWTIDVASGARKEIGAAVDNRQGRPQWSPDGKWLYFTLSSRGNSSLNRLPSAGGAMERVAPAADARGNVMGFAVGKDGLVALTMTTPASPAELYTLKADAGAAGAGAPGVGTTTPMTAVTTLNKELLGGKTIGEVESVVFKTFDGKEIETFLTKPTDLKNTALKDAAAEPVHSHPMILMIHGGPHGQQGPAFIHKGQAYAARGWATLQVNYRGSTGYGQAFANLIARDQNGGEGKDLLAAVDAVLAKNPWIDPERLGVEGGSYGGQLTNWVVTQTTRFKAGVPWASLSNLVSHNYMSVYHDYLEQEYGGRPHTGGIMDMLWQRSAMRFVQNVKTPMMLSHGDNDLLVNPEQIEQFYIALKDVGVETIMLRYPREGHGMRENAHVADFLQRSIDWYEKHFVPAKPQSTN